MIKMIKAQTSQESIYYYHFDHLGTPIMLTDSNQAIVWDATYDPFGKATVTTAIITNNLRFPGQYYDSETGLHYNWHRYYWPETGRYVSADLWNISVANLPMQNWPKGALHIYGEVIKKTLMLNRGKTIEEILDSLHPYNYFLDDQLNQNLYDYVKSNPLIYTDPYGLFKCDTYCLSKCFFTLFWAIGIGEEPAIAGCLLSPNPACCILGVEFILLPAQIGTGIGCIQKCCKKDTCVGTKCQ